MLEAVPGELWEKPYCGMPLWKHAYHMLHSLDRWMINPAAYTEPPFHTPGLNDLDEQTGELLTKEDLILYFQSVREKLTAYLERLTDDWLLEQPENCVWSRFTLILAQYRHLHTHLGMLMGFIVAHNGLWPRVAGLEDAFPPQNPTPYF